MVPLTRFHVVSNATASRGSSELAAQAERLVLDAFAAARRKGLDDWSTMNLGVLNNRLLQMTNRSFSLDAFGADSIRTFIELIPNVVEHVPGSAPAQIRLTSEGMSRVSDDGIRPNPESSARVRDDLWDAILDYSSDGVWVWDSDASQAVLVEGGDVVPSEQLVLPTVGPDDLSEWRSAFAKELEGLSEEQIRTVRNWLAHGLGTSALPSSLRAQWNSVLKARVAERLQEWFTRHPDVQPPQILEVRAGGPSRSRSAQEPSELRRFVQRCVSLMSEDELRSLSIPIEVALRARGD